MRDERKYGVLCQVLLFLAKIPRRGRNRVQHGRGIKKMNEDRPCPKCQKIHKWKAMTEFEIGQQENMIANIMNKDISKQR